MSLKKNILKSIAGKSILLVSGYVLTIAISRYYGAAGSGIINYYFSLYAFIAVFFTAGMDTALNYYLSSGKISPQKISSFAFVILVAVHIIVGLLILLQAIFYNVVVIPGHLVLFLLFITGIAVTNIFSALLNAEGRLFKYNIVLSLGQFILLTFLFYHFYNGIHASEQQFLYWLGATVYGSGLIVALMFFINKKLFHFTGLLIEEKKMIFKASIIFFITALLNLLLIRLDYWFVKHSCSNADLGNYIQSSRFGQIALLLPGMISYALFPDTVKKAEDGNTNNITLLAKIYFYGAIFFCIIFMLCGSVVFPFLFGESFDNMPVIFTLSTPGIIFMAFSYPYSIYFPAIQKIKVLIFSLLCTIIFLVIVYNIISPQNNVYYFTIASSVGFMLYSIILLIAFCKRNHVKLISLFLVNTDEITRLRTIFSQSKY